MIEVLNLGKEDVILKNLKILNKEKKLQTNYPQKNNQKEKEQEAKHSSNRLQ